MLCRKRIGRLGVASIILMIFLMVGSVAYAEVSSACPRISAVGPGGITRPQDTLEFRVVIDPQTIVTGYEWTVSSGVIEDGRGTAQITVRSSRSDNDKMIRASVALRGLPSECKNTAEVEAVVSSGFHPVIIDVFGNIRTREKRSRLDVFLSELAKNPRQKGAYPALSQGQLKFRLIETSQNYQGSHLWT